MTLDSVYQVNDLVALIPEMILSLAALGILLGDVFLRRGTARPSGRWVGVAASMAFLAAAVANAFLLGAEVTGTGGQVAVDGYRVVANFVLLAAAFLGCLFSFDYLEREGLYVGEFFVLLLLATVGMMVLVAARDLILLFVGLELMSIAVYVLTGFDRRNPRSAEAGLKYFLVGAFASAFLLYGIALLYGVTGTTSLVGIGPRVATAMAENNVFLLSGVAFLVVGFGFKISAVPFHMWTPDAYDGAPTPVTGYMAAGVKAAAFVALLRVLTVDLVAAQPVWGAILWWLALLTMIVPNLIALAQDSVKRMLAYSSVAHAGYLLVGLLAGSTVGRAAVLFYLAVYTLMTIGAFAVVYAVAGKGDERSGLSDFAGLGWRRPLLACAMVIFLLSLAGFPPTGGFVGKLYLLRAAVGADQLALAVTLVLTSLVSYYYYFRVVWKMYFEEAPEGILEPAPSGPAFRLAAAVCVVGVLVAGVIPGPAVDVMDRAARDIPSISAAEVVYPRSEAIALDGSISLAAPR